MSFSRVCLEFHYGRPLSKGPISSVCNIVVYIVFPFVEAYRMMYHSLLLVLLGITISVPGDLASSMSGK